MKQQHIVILVLFASIMACVKPYDFDPQSFEKVLVIDGAVSNQPGPYSVLISYTYPLDTVLNEKVTTASVWVEDQNGTAYNYSISESGNYTSPAGFTGQVGNSYRLFVEMPDGQRYSSEAELLNASPDIDSIYGRYGEEPTEEGDRNVGGIQFFVDSENAGGTTRYFRYEWEEAYKIVVPYPASHELQITEEDTTLVPLQTPKGICYQENASNSLIYGTTVGSQGNRIVEFPVRFVSQEIQQLRTRYALLVKQYAISESAYLFYKRLRENNESGGSLFDKQTGSVFGNMISEDDPDQAVLGFFEVAGVSQKRTFFSRAGLDDKLSGPDFPYNCHFTQSTITTPDSAFFYLNRDGGNVYLVNDLPPVPEIRIQSQGCTDCSFYASVVPPDYWIE